MKSTETINRLLRGWRAQIKLKIIVEPAKEDAVLN